MLARWLLIGSSLSLPSVLLLSFGSCLHDPLDLRYSRTPSTRMAFVRRTVVSPMWTWASCTAAAEKPGAILGVGDGIQAVMKTDHGIGEREADTRRPSGRDADGTTRARAGADISLGVPSLDLGNRGDILRDKVHVPKRRGWRRV